MPAVFIHASDVAACIGKHPYQPQCDVILKYIKRLYPQRYQQLLQESNIIDENETLRNAMTKIGSDLCESIESITHVSDGHEDTPCTLKDRLNVVIEACNNADKLVNEEKRVLIDHCRSAAYTSFGTRQEANVSDVIEKASILGQNVKFIRGDGTYQKRYICSIGKVHVYVGGRIDAATGDGRIVEIKNRVNRLFGKMVEYERIQVMSYMYIYGVSSGVLVERFNDDVLTHDVEFDSAFWNEVVVPGLKDFAATIQDKYP